MLIFIIINKLIAILIKFKNKSECIMLININLYLNFINIILIKELDLL